MVFVKRLLPKLAAALVALFVAIRLVVWLVVLRADGFDKAFALFRSDGVGILYLLGLVLTISGLWVLSAKRFPLNGR